MICGERFQAAVAVGAVQGKDVWRFKRYNVARHRVTILKDRIFLEFKVSA